MPGEDWKGLLKSSNLILCYYRQPHHLIPFINVLRSILKPARFLGSAAPTVGREFLNLLECSHKVVSATSAPVSLADSNSTLHLTQMPYSYLCCDALWSPSSRPRPHSAGIVHTYACIPPSSHLPLFSKNIVSSSEKAQNPYKVRVVLQL